jgi:hypothetical protein
MRLISRLEQDSRLDGAVSAGQRLARLIRPGQVRDVLHGVWLKDGRRLKMAECASASVPGFLPFTRA